MRPAGLFLAVLSFGLAVSGCSGLKSASSGGTGSSNAVVITVSPTSGNVVVSQTFTFQATVTGSTNTAANWLVDGVAGGNSAVGTIAATGVYTAPASVPNPANVTVTAVSQADTSK